jgi:DNA-binding SARP family transcriptional activator/tetratricopeptide (TPR) repeat protein
VPEAVIADSSRGVDIQVLGPLRAVLHGRDVTPRNMRGGRLLALLAVNANTTVPTARVIEVLWHDPPASARQQVHNVVSALRRSLEGSSAVQLVTDAAGYRLGVDERAVDVLRFRMDIREAERLAARDRLAEAAELLKRGLGQWQGAAFTGLASPALDRIASFLDEQRLIAAEHLAALQMRFGDTQSTVGWLQQLVIENPLRESLRATLMRVLCKVGRQAEAIIVFEAGRSLLDEELGLLPGPQLQAAHREALADEQATGNAAPAPRPPGSSDVTGHGAGRNSFLPRDIGEFTGRRSEIRRLAAHAQETGTTAPAVLAINGMGGVGKSTLAIHLAHLLAGQYSGGHYFVDLHGFSPGTAPLTSAQALRLLLRDSGLAPELMPTDLEGRVALWRARLAGRRVLVVLDNALDAAQIRPVLAGTTGALVLVTSRDRLPALEGAMTLSLDVMPPDDAVALFAGIAGEQRAAAEPQAVSAVVELCGRLPLAIQVAAARLRERPTWSIGYLVAQLSDHYGRRRILAAGDRDVTDVLAWSYDHLTEQQQRVFRLLSIHSGPTTDIYAAAALCGLPLDDVAACLEELFDVHLLEQPAPGRYRLHDLVRDCAREITARHADRAEHSAATDRLLDYWLHCVTLWCRPITTAVYRFDPSIRYEPTAVPQAEGNGEVIALLGREHLNLTAAIRLAAESGRPEHAWLLTCSLVPYFSLLHFGDEAALLLEQALHCARETGNALGESSCLTGLALAHRARGSAAQARDLVSRAIAISRDRGDRAREIAQQTSLGVMYIDDNLFDAALECFAVALEAARQSGDRQAEALLDNNLGVVHREYGRLDEALTHFQQALALNQDALLHARSLTLSNVGELLCLQGRHRGAVDHFEQALEIGERIGSTEGQVSALTGLCTVHRILGRQSLSLQLGRRAMEMARTEDLFDMECDALGALGDTRLALGDLQTAQQLFDQALVRAQDRGSARYLARAHEGLAHLAAARGDRSRAEDYWGRSLTTYPGGVVSASEAARHRTDPAATCWRCRVGVTGEPDCRPGWSAEPLTPGPRLPSVEPSQ